MKRRNILSASAAGAAAAILSPIDAEIDGNDEDPIRLMRYYRALFLAY
jgi:hypothetical protein